MLGNADIAIFHFINKALANPVFDFIMPLLTNLGSGEFIAAMAILLIIFAKKEKKMAGIYLLAGLTATYIVVSYLKKTVAFPRPFMSLEDVRLLIPKSSGFSFPSYHSTAAFMACAIISKFFNKIKPVVFAIALSVALSRIYVGVHYASDVIAGAVIGLLVSCGLTKVNSRLDIPVS